MDKKDLIWKDKKVYIKLLNSNRSYSGIVIEETEDKIILKDIYSHLVEIKRSEIALMQEEK